MKSIYILCLSLFISTFIFAEVSLKPEISGEASITWGYDLKHQNTGFKASSQTSLDLGISFDPVEEETLEGIHGEIYFSEFSVTVETGSEVELTVPEITANLYLAKDLYLRVATAADPTFNWAQPLGKLISYDDDEFQSGSWFDEDEDYQNAAVYSDYGDTGYGITYNYGALSFMLDIVSNSPWGTTDDDNLTYNLADIDATADDDGYISEAELLTAGFQLVIDALSSDYTYQVAIDPAGNVQVNDQGHVVFYYWNSDKEYLGTTDEIELNSSTVNDNLYTAGVTLQYQLDQVGIFKAYVLPSHNEDRMFSGLGFGLNTVITAIDFIGVDIAADFKLDMDPDSTAAESDKFEYEVSLIIPIKYMELIKSKVELRATDGYTLDDPALDIFADVQLTTEELNLGGSLLLADYTEVFGKKQVAYTLDAKYGVKLTSGIISPGLSWVFLLNDLDSTNDDLGKMVFSIDADFVKNTLFSLSYTANELSAAEDIADIRKGLLTFETKLSY